LSRKKGSSLAQGFFEFHAQLGFVRKRAGRVARLKNVFQPRLHRADRLGVAIDVELVGSHRVKHFLRHISRRDLAGAHGLVAHGLADELATRWFGRFQLVRAVAMTLADAGGHKEGAQHRGADLVGNQRRPCWRC